MKKQERWLYEKWLEVYKQEEEQENISKRIARKKDKIIIKLLFFAGKLLEIVKNVFFQLIFGLLAISATILMSLGVTVLIDPELRTFVFEALGLPFF